MAMYYTTTPYGERRAYAYCFRLISCSYGDLNEDSRFILGYDTTRQSKDIIVRGDGGKPP